MSDQLYRTNEPYAEEIHHLIEIRMLIPVEPCEHGNYARHPYHHRSKWGTESYEWCDGQPKEDE